MSKQKKIIQIGIDHTAVLRQLEQRVRLQKGIKRIKGIQIVAHNIDVLDGKIYVGYCTKIKEMTVDFTDGSNVIVTLENLEALLST
jgi:hypothetical protein